MGCFFLGSSCAIYIFFASRTYRTWIKGSGLSGWSINDSWDDGWNIFPNAWYCLIQTNRRVNSWDVWRRIHNGKHFQYQPGARFGSFTVVVAFVHGENSHNPANFEENRWFMCNLRLSQWVPWFSYTHGVFLWNPNMQDEPYNCVRMSHVLTGWWFQTFFIITPTWGNDPFWLIFFNIFQMGWFNHQLD